MSGEAKTTQPLKPSADQRTASVLRATIGFLKIGIPHQTHHSILYADTSCPPCHDDNLHAAVNPQDRQFQPIFMLRF